ncbi:MAG: hypothetical protein HKN85_08450 [Gammaproteobacteria bacterium]|nr:hypothetical protein [Gammaproteobacteria bacterium]
MTCLSVFALFLCLSTGYADQINGTSHSDNNSFGDGLWRSQINGTPGDDRIRALAGDDLVFAGNGRDILYGDEGSDRLHGENGNDYLDGGHDARDYLYGGPGDDEYLIVNPRDRIIELSNQGLDYVRSYADYSLARNVEYLQLEPPPGDGSQIVLFDASDQFAISTICETLTEEPYPCIPAGSVGIGNDQDNALSGNNMDNRLVGLGGNDLLLGYQGNDVLSGGAGNDVLAGFTANGHWASTEHDTLTGGPGADLFVIGISNRPEGILDYRFRRSSPFGIDNERFPQYLAQGRVTITDFDRTEGDKIEVYGNISDYRVVRGSTSSCGRPCVLILWNGEDLGYETNEYVGTVLGIENPGELDPVLDFY